MFRKVLLMAALAVMFLAGAAQADILTLTNAGFETGDFTGWTVESGEVDVDLYVSEVSEGGFGNYEAVLWTSTISQTLATTEGTDYTVSFLLASDDADSDSSFSVLVDGTEAWSTINAGAFDYMEQTIAFTATGESTTLSFATNSAFASYHMDAVPLPGAVWLMGTGLLGLLGIKRRKA